MNGFVAKQAEVISAFGGGDVMMARSSSWC